MSNKFKPWQNSERRPKKFRKASMGETDFDPNDRRTLRDKRDNKNRKWQTDWDKEP
jgi:hypothetical protein